MGQLNRRTTAAEPAQSGELLDVVALDRNGVLVTTDGALVRVVEVTPRNPRVMGVDAQERVAEGLATMVGRLRVGESLQFYVDATPVLLDDVVAGQREEIHRALAHHPPEHAAALGRLADAHEASLHEHASRQAAVRFRTYVVVPYVPAASARRVDWNALRPGRRSTLPRAPLTRALADHERVVRESLVHTETIVADLEALDLAAQPLAGPEVAELLYRRFNPSTVAAGHVGRLVVVGELDALADARAAVAAAVELREQIAASPIDFDDSRFVGVESDLERVHYVSSIPDITEFGWLLRRDGDRPPVRAQRARPRLGSPQGAQQGARPAQAHARVHRPRRAGPPRPRRRHDRSAPTRPRALLDELRGRDRASIHEVSIYQTVREPGPLADPVALVEASERAVAAIRDAGDADARYGGWMQRDLWLSTLPLGRDVARRTKRYVSKNVGDTIPLGRPELRQPDRNPVLLRRGRPHA